jgi:hypothetical protein
MPNWCSNKLAVIGNNENLTVFKDQVRGIGTDICLNNLVPMPKELEGTRSPGDKYNWYDWRIRNWGTHWDVDAHLIDKSEDALIYEFESPWCPPYNWIRKVALIFPDLSFELYYKEPGMCFQGVILAQKDLFIKEEEDYFEKMDMSDEELEEICEDVEDIISIARRE